MTASQDPEPIPGEAAAPSRRRRRLLAGLGIVAVLVLLVGAYAVVRYVPAVDDARALRADLEGMVDRVRANGLDLDAPTLDALEGDLAAAIERHGRIEQLLAGDPLVAVARVLPVAGTNVRAADGISTAAGELLDAVGEGLVIGRGFVGVREWQAADKTGASVIPKLVELMTTSRENAAAANTSVERARRALDAIPAGAIGPLNSIVTEISGRIDEYGPLLGTFADASEQLPAILGWDEPRRYLVLTQDPAEIRPTGGFIGSYGIVTFDKGHIGELVFRDVTFLDFPQDYPRIEPPQDLAAYVLDAGEPWQLADANWSPHFPTSAADALRIYTNESGDADVDGLIALTTYTIDELLDLTGPVTVPEYDVTIGPGESTLKILELTRVPASPGENRKAFLSTFAETLLGSLLAVQPGTWPTLPETLDALRRGHHLLAWFADPAEQELLAATGFDGSVRADEGDFVYPVDSNAAPSSKLDLVTPREWSLAVALDEAGNARNTLDTAWDNRVNEPEWEAYRALEGVGGETLGMYSRVLVPAGSRVEAVTGGGLAPVTAPSTVRDEAGRLSIGTYLQIAPGEASLRTEWTSPDAADATDAAGTYRLTIQKQPGVVPGPLALRIDAPEGYRITAASPELTVDGATATLATTFAEDIVVFVRYER
jgi:hypothetical protein